MAAATDFAAAASIMRAIDTDQSRWIVSQIVDLSACVSSFTAETHAERAAAAETPLALSNLLVGDILSSLNGASLSGASFPGIVDTMISAPKKTYVTAFRDVAVPVVALLAQLLTDEEGGRGSSNSSGGGGSSKSNSSDEYSIVSSPPTPASSSAAGASSAGASALTTSRGSNSSSSGASAAAPSGGKKSKTLSRA